jgi:hypothetical protein
VTNSPGRLGIGEFRREETTKKEAKKKIILAAVALSVLFAVLGYWAYLAYDVTPYSLGTLVKVGLVVLCVLVCAAVGRTGTLYHALRSILKDKP